MSNENSNQILLKTFPLLATLFMVGFAILSFVFDIKNNLCSTFSIVATVVLLFVLSRTYFIHEKNAMKAALSAILAILSGWEFFYFADNFQYLVLSEEPVEYYFYDWFCMGVDLFTFVALILITILHFLLTSEHKSNPRRVKTNTIILMLIVLVFLVSLVFDFAEFSQAVPGKKWWGREFSMICAKITQIIALVEVVRIEILLDMFRSIREKKNAALS